jgi:hypothetical protein
MQQCLHREGSADSRKDKTVAAKQYMGHKNSLSIVCKYRRCVKKPKWSGIKQ